MSELKWPIYQKSYTKEKLTYARLVKAKSHPLQGVLRFNEKDDLEEAEENPATDETKKGRGDSVMSGPLSDPLSIDPLSTDPLSADPLAADTSESVFMFAESTKRVTIKPAKMRRKSPPATDDWLPRRAAILAKFTTSQKLTLSATSNKHERANNSSNLPEKVRDRLEQLDEIEDAPSISNLTQAEYSKKIDEMGKALYESWHQEQRVKALKLCIQLSKLLIDTTASQFYPSKFVLITDILIKFGGLVFDRLKYKSGTVQGQITIPLRADFTPADVPDTAQETASNWFFKIASIRELLPRLYLQLSILKSNKFLSVDRHREVLTHIAYAARGVGDPLVANYLRCFICRVGYIMEPLYTSYLHPVYQDAMFIYPQIMRKGKKAHDMTFSAYCITHTPAYDWLLTKLIATLSAQDLDQLIVQSAELQNKGILLNALLSSLPQQYITEHVFELLEQITNCKETAFPTVYLLKNLCSKLDDSPSLSLQSRKRLVRDVGKHLTSLDVRADEFIECSVVWLDFICLVPSSSKYLDVLLEELIKNLLPARTFETCYPTLEKILGTILGAQSDIMELFSLTKFLPFLDLFQKESVKVDACKAVLQAYQRKCTNTTNSLVAINSLMYISKTLHNSVNALTIDDQKRDISELINCFIANVDHGKDFEEQLAFYVECRASFSNLDAILAYLVQCVCNLSVSTLNIVKGTHTKKSGSFIRGCLAYCYITIPSISSVFTRLDLYLLAGECALLNSSLVQCDAMYKESLTLIPEVPATLDKPDGRPYSTEDKLVDWVSRYVSSLLYVPDNPSQTPLHLYRELCGVVESYQYWSSEGRLQISVILLTYLISVAQPSFNFTIPNVDSNDKLYGQNKKYLQQVDDLINELLVKLTTHIEAIENLAQEKANISELNRLAYLIIGGFDITKPNPYKLLSKVAALCAEGSDKSTFVLVSMATSTSAVRSVQIKPILQKLQREVLAH